MLLFQELILEYYYVGRVFEVEDIFTCYRTGYISAKHIKHGRQGTEHRV